MSMLKEIPTLLRRAVVLMVRRGARWRAPCGILAAAANGLRCVDSLALNFDSPTEA
jgi:hypothetical protein